MYVKETVEKKFKSVTITIEGEEEFKEFYTIFNFHPITQSCNVTRDLFEALNKIRKDRDIQYYDVFDVITEKIIAGVKKVRG